MSWHEPVEMLGIEGLRRSTKPQHGEMAGARNYPRMWVVEIWLQIDPQKRVKAEGPDLHSTIQAAVGQAKI